MAPLGLRTILRTRWRFFMAAEGGFATVEFASFLVLTVEE